MAVYHQKPQILSAEDMFVFWANNLKKDKPHLIIKNLNTTGKTTELWYEVKQELAYLHDRNLYLDAKIQELEILDKDIRRFTPLTEEIFEMKKEIMNNKYKIKDLEKLPGDKKEMILDYKKFKEVVTLFNTKASNYIIKGNTLNLGNRLGYVQIRKIEDQTKSERIDWGESYAYKKELISKNLIPKDKENPEGKNWLVYKLQPYYLRWAWVKRSNRECTVKNNRVYAFYPTSSSSTTSGKEKVLGNKAKLAQAQKEDSLLHTRYTVVNLREWLIKKGKIKVA